MNKFMSLSLFIVSITISSRIYSSGTKFDSLNLSLVGNWPFGFSCAVAYDSARQLVFCGSGGGVYIIDVSDSTKPRKVSEKIHTRGMVEELFYESSNHRLFIADGPAGLEIWDISTSTNPVKLGFYETRNYAYGISVSGSYAYIADDTSGLLVINVSNPVSPRKQGF